MESNKINLISSCILISSLLSSTCHLARAAPRGIDLSKQKTKFQGDITNYPKRTPNVARNAIKLDYLKWPNAVVPYEIRPTFGSRQTMIILNGMRRIEKDTCVKFVQRTTEKDYIIINNTRDGCYSAIGREGGGQEVSLQDGDDVTCVEHPTVVHELLHVLGLDHEQSRYDRDQFVTINFQNIERGYDDQFQIFSPLFSSFYGVSYDYKSVMHYSAYAFSKSDHLITIMPKDPTQLSIIGKAADASRSDLLKINNIYGCSSPTLAGNTECVDKQPAATCSSYASRCGNWDLLKVECAKTCGFCSTGLVGNAQPKPSTEKVSCVDTIDKGTCEHYSELNYCDKWPVLKNQCKKTCNFCV